MLSAEQLRPLLDWIKRREEHFDAAVRIKGREEHFDAARKEKDERQPLARSQTQKWEDLKQRAGAPDQIFLHELELLGSTWVVDTKSRVSQTGSQSDVHLCICLRKLFLLVLPCSTRMNRPTHAPNGDNAATEDETRLARALGEKYRYPCLP